MTTTRLRWGAAGATALLLAGIAVYARCKPPPAPKVEERAKVETKADTTASATTVAAKAVTRKRGPSTLERYRPDGSLASKLTLGPVETNVQSSEQRQEQSAAHVEQKAESERIETPAAGGKRFALRLVGGVPITIGKDIDLRPQGKVEAEAKILGPLGARVSYSPPFANHEREHVVTVEATLTVVEF